MTRELAVLSGLLAGRTAPPGPGPDDDALLELANHHGLAPWISRRDYDAHARRNLCLLAEAAAVVDALECAGIQPLVLKGPLLAQQLWGDLALRQSGDIDLLVPRQQAARTLSVLAGAGYRMAVPLEWAPPATAVRWNSEIPFRSPSGVEVDVHWGLHPSHSPFRLDPAALFESPVIVSAAGRQFRVPAPEPALVCYAIHGTRHLWERLVWIGDIARIAAAIPDWRQVWQLARLARAESALRVALALASEFGGLAERPALSRGEAQALDCAVHRLRAGILPEPRTGELLHFQALLTPSPAALLRHLGGLAIRPTEHDWRLARLSPPFSVLYYPLRVGRLARDYGRNLRSSAQST